MGVTGHPSSAGYGGRAEVAAVVGRRVLKGWGCSQGDMGASRLWPGGNNGPGDWGAAHDVHAGHLAELEHLRRDGFPQGQLEPVRFGP